MNSLLFQDDSHEYELLFGLYTVHDDLDLEGDNI